MNSNWSCAGLVRIYVCVLSSILLDFVGQNRVFGQFVVHRAHTAWMHILVAEHFVMNNSGESIVCSALTRA